MVLTMRPILVIKENPNKDTETLSKEDFCDLIELIFLIIKN